jgi:hypothetical protein
VAGRVSTPADCTRARLGGRFRHAGATLGLGHACLHGHRRLDASHARARRRFLDRLEADHDNFRAALSWLLDPDPDDALTLAHALILFWYTRGHVREGRDWLVEALERASPAASATRAAALDWTGYFFYELGEDGGARLEQAVSCAREADVGAVLALALRSHFRLSS